MKKFLIISLICLLTLLTAIVKNSTKKIDDNIFTTKETIRDLKKDFENVKLEYEYLSSAERLLEMYDLYFDDKLIKKSIQEIKIINQKFDKQKIEKLKLIND